jgi:hypothetical protein
VKGSSQEQLTLFQSSFIFHQVGNKGCFFFRGRIFVSSVSSERLVFAAWMPPSLASSAQEPSRFFYALAWRALVIE